MPVQLIIDAEDQHIVAGRSVYLDGKGYPRIWLEGKNVGVHRLVAKAPDGVEVDHVNGDVLDVRRCNLRLCSRSENMRNRGLRSTNSSGLKGVSFSRCSGKWRAYLQVDGRQKHLGLFDSAELAGLAHDAAAQQYHGVFAWLNYGGTAHV